MGAAEQRRRVMQDEAAERAKKEAELKAKADIEKKMAALKAEIEEKKIADAMAQADRDAADAKSMR